MDLNSDFMQAIYDGNEEKIRTLLASHGFCHTLDGGYSLLVDALSSSKFAIARVLITSGAQVNNAALPQRSHETPLHLAINSEQMDIAEMLVNRGADINAIDYCHLTPIRSAIQSENLEFLELLYNRDFDLNARGPDGLRPLHIAVQEDKPDAVVFLLSYGADIEASSADNKTALYFAVEEVNLRIVKLLLKFQPDVNNEGNKNALYAAISTKRCSGLMRIEIFWTLLTYGFMYELEAGCDPKFFHGAIELEFFEIVKDLLTYGADANMYYSGQTALLLAMKNRQGDFAELLVSYGADVNAHDRQKKTPIYYAVNCGNAKLVKILLAHGATVSGYPDIMTIAISVDSPEIVKELLKYGVDVNMEYSDQTALLLAMKEKQTDMVELLVSSGADVNAHDGQKKTPIYYAVKYGNAKLVKILLAHGATVSGYPDIMTIAISVESPEIVKELLKYGVDVNCENIISPSLMPFMGFDGAHKDGIIRTPIYYAAQSGNTELVKILLSHGATVSGYPDVMRAALSAKSSEIVKELLKFGADPYVVYCGQTPFLLAIRTGDLSLVEDLLKNGADANKEKNGETPLMMAINTNQPDVAELLLSYGADVNAQHKGKKIPIYYAVESGNVKLFNVLLTHGATISDYPHIVHAAISGKSPEIVQQLLNLGNVDINDCTFGGTPALLASLQTSCADVTALLLEKGTDVSVRFGQNEDTPLHILSAKGDHSNCEILLKKGAAVGSRNKEGRTPLHCAVNAEIVKTLIHSGADINARDLDGQTPLHIAVKEKQENVVLALLKFDADVDSTDKIGKTALHLACRSLQGTLVRLLLDYGADINICDNYLSTTMNRGNSYLRHFDKIKVKTVIRQLLLHIDKMEMINYYVSDKNLAGKQRAHRDLLFLSEDVLKIRRQQYKQEIGKLQTTKIINANVTYYEFLTKNTSSLAALLGNENILQAFQPGNANAKEFRNFNPLLNLQFRKAMERKGLIEQCYEIFAFLCRQLPLLPTCCVEEIFQYFSNKDLKMFAAVRGPPRQFSTED